MVQPFRPREVSLQCDLGSAALPRSRMLNGPRWSAIDDAGPGLRRAEEVGLLEASGGRSASAR